MEFEFQYQLSEEFQRRAARRLLIHHFGWRVPITSALFVLVVALMCQMDMPGYVCGFFAGAGILLFTLVLLAQLVRSRQSRQLLRKMHDRTVSCRFSDQGLHMESELGIATLPWSRFSKLVRAPEVWLFFLDWQQSVALPASGFTDDASRFVEDSVAAAGGRVLGKTPLREGVRS